MAYTQLIYHIVIRTKYCHYTIPEANERKLYEYLHGFVKRHNGMTYQIGGMPDHIHLLVQLPASVAIADFVRQLKLTSHNFIKEHRQLFPDFESWSVGYCALSYAMDEVPKVTQYIKGQKEHHKQVAFADELRALLAEQGVAIKEEYFLKDE